MDPIKDAFFKIKQDIFSLQDQIYLLKQEIEQLRLQQTITNTPQPHENKQQTPQIHQQNTDFSPTKHPLNPTPEPFPTDTPTQTPTPPHEVGGLKTPNLTISTGNGGVPTDKPTDRQTNQQTDNYPKKFVQSKKEDTLNEFQQAQDILDSLDNIKKGIRLKFKRLTSQEMLVFSTLYSLEEQNIEEITYKLIANNLNLSESSIRDYTNKLINKGIPLIKTRQNNKKIALSISPDLKNIATLATINKLRDI